MKKAGGNSVSIIHAARRTGDHLDGRADELRNSQHLLDASHLNMRLSDEP